MRKLIRNTRLSADLKPKQSNFKLIYFIKINLELYNK